MSAVAVKKTLRRVVATAVAVPVLATTAVLPASASGTGHRPRPAQTVEVCVFQARTAAGRRLLDRWGLRALTVYSDVNGTCHRGSWSLYRIGFQRHAAYYWRVRA